MLCPECLILEKFFWFARLALLPFQFPLVFLQFFHLSLGFYLLLSDQFLFFRFFINFELFLACFVTINLHFFSLYYAARYFLFNTFARTSHGHLLVAVGTVRAHPSVTEGKATMTAGHLFWTSVPASQQVSSLFLSRRGPNIALDVRRIQLTVAPLSEHQAARRARFRMTGFEALMDAALRTLQRAWFLTR